MQICLPYSFIDLYMGYDKSRVKNNKGEKYGIRSISSSSWLRDKLEEILFR